MKESFLRVVCVSFLMTFLGLTSCEKQKKMDNSTQENRSLTLCIASDITTLDQRVSFLMPTIHILRELFEGLTRLGPDGKPCLALAERYDLSEDGKVYTFHLRPSVWSNGEAVTAHDFAYSWRGALSLSKPTLPKAAFYPIKNVEAYVLGKCTIDDVGIRVIDDSTIQLELEHLYDPLLQLLAYPSFAPIPKKIDEANSNWTKQTGHSFVCNGPFTLKTHLEGNKLVLAKNPMYWDAAAIKLNEILFYVIPDIATQDALFQKGEIDFIGEPLVELPSDIITRLEQSKELQEMPSTGVFWCALNTQHPLLHYPKMREALASAINRNDLIKHILPAGFRPASSVLPLQMSQMHDQRFSDGDAQKAKKLFQEVLDEAGLTLADIPSLTLLYLPKDIVVKSVEVICDQWKKTLGLDIKRECVEIKTLLTRLKNGAFDLGAYTWFSWLADPMYTMRNYRSKEMSYNYTGWSDPAYTQLIHHYEGTPDKERRQWFLHQAEEVMMRDLPVIPIYLRAMNFAKKDSLQNVVITPYNELELRWAYLQ